MSDSNDKSLRQRSLDSLLFLYFLPFVYLFIYFSLSSIYFLIVLSFSLSPCSNAAVTLHPLWLPHSSQALPLPGNLIS